MKKSIFILLFFITQYSFSSIHHRYFCADGGSATYTIADIDLRNIVYSNSYSWYSDATGTTELSTSETLVNNGVYYLINDTGSYVREFRIHIEENIPAPTIQYYYAEVCGNYLFQLDNDFPSFLGYGTENDLIYWFETNDNTGTPLIELPSYFGSVYYSLYGFLSLDDCATASVEIFVDSHYDTGWDCISGSQIQYFLSADNPTVSDIIAYNNCGNDVYWFDGALTSLDNNSPLNQNIDYYGYPYEYIQDLNYFGICDSNTGINIKLDHNSINGTIKFDIDNNGCSANDIYVPNVTVTSTNGTNTFTTFSRNGNYTQHIYNTLGDFNTTIDVPYYFDVNPNPLTTTFNTYNSYSNTNSFTGDFCLTANQNAEDVTIDILTNPIRPGFNTSCKLIYQNKGTQQANGNITFNFDDSKLTFLNTNGTIISQTTNSITFSYSDLNPFETDYININFEAFQPPTTNIDDVVSFDASITPLTNDITPSDNTIVVDRTVIDSFDPNDITCIEGNTIEYNTIDKYLHYIIRFENTGSAEAINIKVENELDPKLDWSTFKMISSSHDNRVEMKDGAISFIFSHINLPFTAPESQGYIYYKIKLKNNVVLGDTFNNKADIFFDYNAAIETNIASTTIINSLAVNNAQLLQFSVYPTPTKDILHIQSKTALKSVAIYSKLGQLVLQNTNTQQINISKLASGIYFVKVQDTHGNFGVRKIVKE